MGGILNTKPIFGGLLNLEQKFSFALRRRIGYVKRGRTEIEKELLLKMEKFAEFPPCKNTILSNIAQKTRAKILFKVS